MQVNQIKLKMIDICKGYTDTESAIAMSGDLIIRPPMQRQFIYPKARQVAVMETLLDNAPIGIVYLTKNLEKYEVVDGQQRLLSILEYIKGTYKVRGKYYFDLNSDDKKKIQNPIIIFYEIIAKAEDDITNWWERINYPGTKLTNMEIICGCFPGTYVSELKEAFGYGGKYNDEQTTYIQGSVKDLKNLNNIMKWIVRKGDMDDETKDDDIKNYVRLHRHESAEKDVSYVLNVIEFIKKINPLAELSKKTTCWDQIYKEFHDKEIDFKEIESRAEELFGNSEITKKAGIYEYLFFDDEKVLSIRAFSRGDIERKAKQQDNKCAHCHNELQFNDSQGDHIVPWKDGGLTVYDNLQVLCGRCNRAKSSKHI